MHRYPGGREKKQEEQAREDRGGRGKRQKH